MSRIFTIAVAIVIALVAYLFIHNNEDKGTVPSVQPTIQEHSSVIPQAHLSKEGFEKWREFTSPTGRFKVLFPSLPQHTADTVLEEKKAEPRKYDTFIAVDEKGAAFVISAITFPAPLQAQSLEDELKSVVEDMLHRNKENKLKTMSMGKFRERKALDFSIVNGKMKISGKVFADKDRLYVLSIISQDEEVNSTELEFFINSFSIYEMKDSPSGLPSKKLSK